MFSHQRLLSGSGYLPIQSKIPKVSVKKDKNNLIHQDKIKNSYVPAKNYITGMPKPIYVPGNYMAQSMYGRFLPKGSMLNLQTQIRPQYKFVPYKSLKIGL